MNTVATCCLTVLLSLPTMALAQNSPVGKYSGSYQEQAAPSFTVGLVLDIASVEDGRVKGVMTVTSRGSCRGQYPMEGVFKADELRMRSIQKGGASGDCSLVFQGKLEGNAFVGKLGPNDVTLRK